MSRPPGGLEGGRHKPDGKRVVDGKGSRLTRECAPHRSKLDFIR